MSWTQWMIPSLVVAAGLSLAGCQKAGNTTADFTEDEVFLAAEYGDAESDASAALATEAQPETKVPGEQEERRRHFQGLKQRPGRFLHYARELYGKDPTVRSVVGFGLRNPFTRGEEADEVTLAECKVRVEIVSSYRLSIQKEPERVAPTPATLSEDGHTITIDRDEAQRTRLIFSVHAPEEASAEPTLTVNGSLKCGNDEISVSRELSAKIATEARRKFMFRSVSEGAWLRGLGINFPLPQEHEPEL